MKISNLICSQTKLLCSKQVPVTRKLFGDKLQSDMIEVKNASRFTQSLTQSYRPQPPQTSGTNLKHKIENSLVIWNYVEKNSTCINNSEILDIINGYQINFEPIPNKFAVPNILNFSEKESEAIHQETNNLLNKGL